MLESGSIIIKICIEKGKGIVMKTFTQSIKEEIVKPGEEKTIFTAEGMGVVTHMWFGGCYSHFSEACINIYYNHEQTPSFSAKMFLLHGVWFEEEDSFSTTLVGKTGHPGGMYNNYQIPYQNGIKITVTISPEETEDNLFWSIVRATEGMELFLHHKKAVNPRLVLHKLEAYTAAPLEEFEIYKASRPGCLFLTSMSAKSRNLEYQEACFRGYFDGQEQLLSSGMEDYFLGTYYFQKGKYQNDVAGVTHFKTEDYEIGGITEEPTEFSGYRFHTDDPIFFSENFRMTLKCGERLREYTFHNPQPTTYNIYVLAYEFDELQ